MKPIWIQLPETLTVTPPMRISQLRHELMVLQHRYWMALYYRDYEIARHINEESKPLIAELRELERGTR